MVDTIWEKAFKLHMDTVDYTSDFFRKMTKMNQMMQTPPPVETGLTPHEVVYRKHKTKVLRYKPAGEKVHETPVFITFALVNKPYVMDLIPGKSIIEILVNAGYEVFLLDWGIPSDSDRDKGLDVYVNYYMDKAVDRVREMTGSDRVSLLGYCMGGAMSIMYTSLHPEKVKNLILMATPFDFSSRESLVYGWSKEFPVDELVDIYGNCPGWYLNLSFAALKPMNAADKAMNFYGKMLDEDFVKLFLAMEKWANDSHPMPGKAYSEFVKGCFQQNLLMNNKFRLGDEIVDVKKIECPVLNLIAEKDHLIPPESSEAVGDAVSSGDVEVMKCKTGHIGLSVSGKALKKTWPDAVEWLDKRSGGKRKVKV